MLTSCGSPYVEPEPPAPPKPVSLLFMNGRVTIALTREQKRQGRFPAYNLLAVINHASRKSINLTEETSFVGARTWPCP